MTPFFISGSISNIDDAEYACNATAVRKVISGVVGAASSVTSVQVANLLRLFRIPQVRRALLASGSPVTMITLTHFFFGRCLSSRHPLSCPTRRASSTSRAPSPPTCIRSAPWLRSSKNLAGATFPSYTKSLTTESKQVTCYNIFLVSVILIISCRLWLTLNRSLYNQTTLI